MKYQIRQVQFLSEANLLSKLIKAADMYSKFAETILLFIFKGSKRDTYEFYEVNFQKRNFMHLVGIKSETFTAEEFYKACLDGTITIKACTPRHSVNNMMAKISVIGQLLDFSHAKCYKIGQKDLITKDNDFEMATGNLSGVIGYDFRVSVKGRKGIDINNHAVPTTLLTNPITDYCSSPQKIIYILQKQTTEALYKDIYYEVKKGLFIEEKDYFPYELKRLIDISAFTTNGYPS